MTTCKKLTYTLLSLLVLLYCASFNSLAAETPKHAGLKLEDGLGTPYAAPEIKGIAAWINSPALSIEALKGKVIFIEFWTTTCPYCIDTIPHLNSWYKRYHDQGLVMIGIHSPKQDFESNLTYLRDAVAGYHIHFPVAADNRFQTWENFGVSYWPGQYLIDKKGDIVYVHYGAHDYEQIENNIRYLLSK